MSPDYWLLPWSVTYSNFRQHHRERPLETYALKVIKWFVSSRLAKRIKHLRAERGLTQAALAKRGGLTLSYIGRLEIGRHDPQLSTLRKLAKALNVTVAELVR